MPWRPSKVESWQEFCWALCYPDSARLSSAGSVNQGWEQGLKSLLLLRASNVLPDVQPATADFSL